MADPLLTRLWRAAIAVFALAVTGGAAAQDLLPGLQPFAAKGELVVAVIDRDAPPMIMTGEDGGPRGFDIQLINAFSKSLRIPLRIVRTAKTYDELIAQVAGGDADIAISNLSRSTQRALYVRFTRPYMRQNPTLLVNRARNIRYAKDCPNARQVARLLATEGAVAVQRGTFYEELARQLAPDTEPTAFDDFADLAAGVRAGSLSISLQGEILARTYLNDNPAARIYVRLCEIAEWEDQIAIAVRPDAPELVDLLDIFLENRKVSVDAETVVLRIDRWGF